MYHILDVYVTSLDGPRLGVCGSHLFRGAIVNGSVRSVLVSEAALCDRGGVHCYG